MAWGWRATPPGTLTVETYTPSEWAPRRFGPRRGNESPEAPSMETWISFASTPPTLETLTERYRTSRWPAPTDEERRFGRAKGGEARGRR